MPGSSVGCVVCPETNASAHLRLLCFPYAGGSAASFAGWHKHLPRQVETLYVQLPGRDGHSQDVLPESFSEVIDALADALHFSLEVPLALFGHSMGALIAFELAREFRRRAWPLPVHLFVSGHRAPQLKAFNPGDRPLHDLPDDDFLAELERRFGPSPDFAESRELAELFLPIVRADLALCATYVYTPEEPLGCSITAFGGADDARVKRNHLAAWRVHTSRAFSLRIFPGGHFFARRDSLLVLNILKQQLERVVRRTPH